MDDIEKHFKMLDDLVIYHVNKTQDFFTWLKQDLDNGDKITNIINFIEAIKEYRETNPTWCAIIRHWVLFHYCNRDEALNFQRAYNDWKIDNKSGITAENAADNQKTLLQALLKVGSLKSTDLPMILSAQKKKDIIHNTKRKSTEILELNTIEIEHERQFTKIVKSAKQPSEDNDNQTDHISVSVWALYYYYLQNAKYIPFFNVQTTTKDEAMRKLLSENGHTFSFNNFRNIFYAIGSGKEKDPLKKSCLEKVIILLEACPIAKQIAKNDLYSYEKGVVKYKYK